MEQTINPVTRLEFYLAALSGMEIQPPSYVTRLEHYLQDIIDGNASDIVPVTRVEHYLAKISGADVEIPEPITRIEQYLAQIAGADIETPDPTTREEYLLQAWAEGSGGGTYGPAEIVSFETKRAKKLKSLQVSLSPIQSLNGYDAPWAGGAGKNKLPLTLANLKSLNTIGTWSGNAYTESGVTYTVQEDDGSNIVGINVNGTATINSFFRYAANLSIPAESYILNGCPSGGDTETYSQYIYVNTATYDTGSGTSPVSISAPFAVNIRVMSGTTVLNKLFQPMIRLASVADDTFAPYSNLCPITGRTGASAWRTGKNLFDSSISEKLDTPIISWGTSDADIVAWFNSLPNGSYAISFTVTIDSKRGSSQNNYYGVILANSVTGNIIMRPNVENPTEGMELDLSGTVTITDANRGKFNNFWMYTGRAMAETPDECTFSNFMVELGSTATDYEPYSGNLFSVEFPTLGANKFDEVTEVGGISTSTGLNIDSITNTLRSKNFNECTPNTEYYCVRGNNNAAFGNGLFWYDADKNFISVSYPSSGSGYKLTSPSNAYYFRIYFGASYGLTYLNDVAVNNPSTVTAYEPYTNTVYSGTVDIVTGVLTVDMAMINLTSSDQIMAYQFRTYNGVYVANKITESYNRANGLCNYTGKVGNYYDENSIWVGANDKYIYWIGILDVLGLSDVSEFMTWLDSNDVQICYELATPITFHVDPQEIKSLVGQNTVWSEDGEVTVKT